MTGGVGDADYTEVELWVPSMVHCTVDPLSPGRYGHSQHGTTVCGGNGNSGDNTGTSCARLTDEGTWETTAITLLKSR